MINNATLSSKHGMVTAKREAPGADTIKEDDSVPEVLSHHGSVYSAFVLLVFILVGTARHTSVRRHRLEFWRDTGILPERCCCFLQSLPATSVSVLYITPRP
jgi:hypothetical protein